MSLPAGVQDLDLGGQRCDLVGVLGDGLRGRGFGEAEIAGRQVGARQGFGPHRRGFGERFESRPDVPASEELVALQLRQRRLCSGAGQLSARASICAASLAWSFLAA